MIALPNFVNITYLKNGPPLQQKAHAVITHSKILYHLQPFQPILTGTLPLDIFIEGKSDLDIICSASDFKSVEKILLKSFSDKHDFRLLRKQIRGKEALICRFDCEDFPVEIFCQDIPVQEQPAYRHMVIEYKLLQHHGENFKAQITELKRQGIKTEPAFAMLLNLDGDPYDAILKYEQENNM